MGWIYVQPDGSWNKDGIRFWSATDACCNFYGDPVDDVAYIEGLIDDLSASYSIDPERIYVVGHSNGGFMAHRLACDLSDRITAIVSIAGAQWFDPHKCNPTSGVAVLEVHGNEDAFVHYNGGAFSYKDEGGDIKYHPPYPSAHQTVGHWARLNGCQANLTRERRRLDLDAKLPGRETGVERFKRCRRGPVELWTIEGGTHFSPVNLGLNWPRAIFEFLIGVQP
jgi:polyhydroxybutyrate depolymerase